MAAGLNTHTNGEDIQIQLMKLRNWTERTGTLHDGQALQLRMWILAVTGTDFFQDYEIEYNFPSKVVTFKLMKPDMKVAPDDLDKRFDCLDENVKWLLGEKHIIKVKAGRKVIYRSPKESV